MRALGFVCPLLICCFTLSADTIPNQRRQIKLETISKIPDAGLLFALAVFDSVKTDPTPSVIRSRSDITVSRISDTAAPAVTQSLDSWKTILRIHPVFSAGSLRGIEGVSRFATGHDVSISGLVPINGGTLRIIPEHGDTSLLSDSNRAIAAAFPHLKLIATADNQFNATSVKNDYHFVKPSGNPVVDVSTGKCDEAVISLKQDLDLLSLPKLASFHADTFYCERYFTALRKADSSVASVLRKLPITDIIKKNIRSDGFPIHKIFSSDTTSDSVVAISDSGLPMRPERLIFPSDDKAALVLAQKISDALKSAGITVLFSPLETVEYERRMIRGDWDIVIGSVAECGGRFNFSEEDLSGMLFSQRCNEVSSIKSGRLIPMFSLTRFVMRRKLPEAQLPWAGDSLPTVK